MSHKEALEFTMDNLEKLNSGPQLVHVGAIGRCIPVMFDMLHCSSDLPKRCKLLWVTTHASTCHRRFGHGMHMPNRDWWKFHLHSCSACHSKRSRTIIESIIIGKCVDALSFANCQICSDFDYDRDRNKTKSTDTEHCPKSLFKNSPPPPQDVVSGMMFF